jgi:hypothetical protein
MRVEDARGLFHRAAGQNAIKRAANNTPFDGGEIGRFGGDKTRNATGSVNFVRSGSSTINLLETPAGVFSVSNEGIVGYRVAAEPLDIGSIAYNTLTFSSTSVFPTSYEFTPASISVYPCISY